MKLDRTTKLLLLLIALGLWLNALTPLFYPVTARAETDSHCTGSITTNSLGGTQPTVGDYAVDVTCH